jgi:hypothetical protein
MLATVPEFKGRRPEFIDPTLLREVEKEGFLAGQNKKRNGVLEYRVLSIGLSPSPITPSLQYSSCVDAMKRNEVYGNFYQPVENR